MDLDEWIPIIGIGLLAVTTFAALVGMLALGKARGLHEGSRRHSEDLETQSRLDRLERQLETMAGEIERLGDVQRFSLKVIGEKLDSVESPKVIPGRVITPH